MNIQFYIYLCYLFGILLYGTVHFNKLTVPYRILFSLLAYTFLTEGYGRIDYYYGIGSTYSIYHLNALVFLFLNALIYSKLHSENTTLRNIILIITFCCFVIALFNSLFNQTPPGFPTFSIVSHAFGTILLSLLSFKEMLKKPTREKLILQSLFWINCGNLVFYSFNFIQFIFFKSFQDLGISTKWFLYISWFGNIFLVTCYLFSLLLNKKASHER